MGKRTKQAPRGAPFQPGAGASERARAAARARWGQSDPGSPASAAVEASLRLTLPTLGALAGAPTILDLLPEFPQLAGDSWAAWRVFLKALDGLGPYVKDDIAVRNAVLEALINDSNPGVRSDAITLMKSCRAGHVHGVARRSLTPSSSASLSRRSCSTSRASGTSCASR